MNNNKSNVFKNDNLETLTITEVVEKMFSLSDENGVLYVPEFGDGISNDENSFQRLELKWNKDDVSEVKKECESIVYEIKMIVSAVRDKNLSDMKKEEIELVLPAMSYAVWINYLEKDYTQVEDKKLFFVLFYAQRFYKLLQLGAPQIILNKERNLLVQAIVVNKYATSIEYILNKLKQPYIADNELKEKIAKVPRVFRCFGTNSSAKDEIAELFGDRNYFQTPKPLKLIKELVRATTNKDSIVLDFFAGSGTTGHAVMDLNKEDGGKRKFVLITNNESNICRNVTIPKIKRVIEKFNYNENLETIMQEI